MAEKIADVSVTDFSVNNKLYWAKKGTVVENMMLIGIFKDNCFLITFLSAPFKIKSLACV